MLRYVISKNFELFERKKIQIKTFFKKMYVCMYVIIKYLLFRITQIALKNYLLYKNNNNSNYINYKYKRKSFYIQIILLIIIILKLELKTKMYIYSHNYNNNNNNVCK